MPREAPNPLVIIEQYERLVAFLLLQRDGQAALIEQLVAEQIRLKDLIGRARRGKVIPCAICGNDFTRGGTRAKYCPTCLPRAKQIKDKPRWAIYKKARRAAGREGPRRVAS